MTSQQIADQLYSLCKKGKWKEAQSKLYSPHAVSIEPIEVSPRMVSGLKAIQKKGEMWAKNSKVYSLKVSEPLVAGNWITMRMDLDSQIGKGPRFKSSELCMYEVKDGKIVSEQFFYNK